MKARNWLLGAATSAILMGSLVGIGCGRSKTQTRWYYVADFTDSAQAAQQPGHTLPNCSVLLSVGGLPAPARGSPIVRNGLNYVAVECLP